MCSARPDSGLSFAWPLQALFQEGYSFSPAPGCEQYKAPPEGPIESYTTFIRSLPDTAPPEVCMLHACCPRLAVLVLFTLPAYSAHGLGLKTALLYGYARF